MQQPNKDNKWLILINIPIQMGVIIYLSHLFGSWLDGKYGWVNGEANKVCTLMGVIIALYQVIQQVKKLNQ